MATSTSGASPGVRMSREAKWIWKADTPATVPAGARISAGKSGSVARSLPKTAVASVNRLPASCIPSPESPAIRTTTRSRVSLAFTVLFKPVWPFGFNGLGVEDAPHLVGSPIVRRIKGDGIELAVSVSGEGVPVLLLHGFPDASRLWRNQLPALHEHGFRTIAPDLRGFGESDKPAEVSEYRVGRSVADVVAILDALEIPRAHVIGHDWGAGVAWVLAMSAPERVDRLAVLSVGHPGTRARRTLEDHRRAWYTLLFQFAEAEALLTREDSALLREWAGSHPDLESVLAELDLTPGLNWYRANLHPARELAPARELPPVAADVLGVWSDGDVYLTERQMVESARFVPSFRYERIDGASHWIPLDAAERVNELILSHLCAPRSS